MGSTQEAFKKDITTMEVVLHTKYTGTELIYQTICNKSKKKQCRDLILKWEIVKKKCLEYKAGDKYCLLYMEEKLAIDSYNNSNELLN